MTERNKAYRISHPDQLEEIATKILECNPESRVFALYGPMGVGKTAFIKAFCASLSVTETVSSPSFPLVNHYRTKDRLNIYHFDFYRIAKIEEAFDLGYEEYFYSGDYCFIEWPEKVAELLPPSAVELYMEQQGMVRIIRL